MNKQVRYVAFLRGVNMIGRKMVKMDAVRVLFESAGLQNVKTISASGNVVFEIRERDVLSLTEMIERKLEKKLGYKVSVVLRTIPEIQKLVDSKPFKQITITPRTKLLLTFLSEKPKRKLRTPFVSPEKDFKILRVLDNEIYSVVTLLPNKYSSGIMSFLEKEFGKKVTTRNWNTILKILKK